MHRALKLLLKNFSDIPNSLGTAELRQTDGTPCIDIYTQLSQYSKAKTHPLIIKDAFIQIATKYTQAVFIYTNTSLTEEGVGSAVVTPQEALKFRLPTETSIFTSELCAKHHAFKYTINHTQPR